MLTTKDIYETEELDFTAARTRQAVMNAKNHASSISPVKEALIDALISRSPRGHAKDLIQLAHHKLYGRNRPTYESAATRKFQEGRTETCRTVSDESVAFCEAMADPEADAERCRDLFRRALEAHVKYITDAGEGEGL
ncbi:hypothetical protein EJ03DRAFT_372550 [Teratosphaeria nubilosa]|uniref:Choline/carnitine acyltransferase domain-containing protein n=1 Tax=Teratosphaeria nubilosa TaxID=161662 RepID=A0A6G1LGH9_9PEZI|nr:hypothetical protein EJ03DRAFT_372550 [Teratosphaeria nubilosa]